MKKALFLGVFLLLGTFVLFAQSKPVLTIVNNTGNTIYYIYISESDNDDWEEDVLGDDQILLPGESFNCHLPHTGTWDLLAEDENEDIYELYEIRVRSGSNRVVLK